MEFYENPEEAVLPGRKSASPSKYRNILANLEPGRWYIVASAEAGDKKLTSAGISFRKHGAKVAIRADGTGKVHLYVQKESNK